MPGLCSEPFLPERTITTSAKTQCRQGTLEWPLLSFSHTLHAGLCLWDRLPWCSGFQVGGGHCDAPVLPLLVSIGGICLFCPPYMELMCWELALWLVWHFVHRLPGDLGCSGFHLREECGQDEVVLSILLDGTLNFSGLYCKVKLQQVCSQGIGMLW